MITDLENIPEYIISIPVNIFITGFYDVTGLRSNGAGSFL
jgi:hypothetical protein